MLRMRPAAVADWYGVDQKALLVRTSNLLQKDGINRPRHHQPDRAGHAAAIAVIAALSSTGERLDRSIAARRRCGRKRPAQREGSFCRAWYQSGDGAQGIG